jgi:hypothetical protein
MDCVSGCTHGACHNGKCVCDDNWTGLTCSGKSFIFFSFKFLFILFYYIYFCTHADASQNFTVTPNQTSPAVTLNSQFSIFVQQIGEVSAQGNSLRSVNLPNQNYTVSTDFSAANVTHIYTTVLANSAIITFIVSCQFFSVFFFSN